MGCMASTAASRVSLQEEMPTRSAAGSVISRKEAALAPRAGITPSTLELPASTTTTCPSP